ncbi:hypothetical protein [Corynebacterium sp. J010B-136]|uniref:hypothetical protein n=1 Tax=Corynebacterium sp. J010B-136 TaxID=2099401 RepID=UPI000CF8F8E0|nr:hypothetical protein [Corynebacterium sp. J010B-136]PQM75553.1 hypothetical protein C5Y44_01965 [Corynebacterium sp. J010B-136]
MNTFQSDAVQDDLVPNDPYQAFVYLQTHGMEILREIFGYSAQELADEGMTLDTAQSYTELADVFFGPTNSPRLQQLTIETAQARGLSLDQLLMIDRHAQSLHNQNAAWMLRAELIAYDGCYDEMDAHAFERVESLGGIKAKRWMRATMVADTRRRIAKLKKTLGIIGSASQAEVELIRSLRK